MVGLITAPFIPRAASAAADNVQMNTFDGTNDYLLRGADLTGNANGKLGIACWLTTRSAGSDGNLGYILSSSGNDIFISKLTGNNWRVRGRSVADDIVMQITTDINVAEEADGYQLCLASWDLNVPIGHLYVNDVDREKVINTTLINEDILYPRANWGIGAEVDGTNKFVGDIGYLYYNNEEYINFDIEANRRKFCTSRGLPVDMGADGSTPTGSVPRVFLNSAFATWPTNDGDGGGFTVTGALADAGTYPA